MNDFALLERGGKAVMEGTQSARCACTASSGSTPFPASRRLRGPGRPPFRLSLGPQARMARSSRIPLGLSAGLQLPASSPQHPAPTRDSLTSRNARKLLKTKAWVLFYPRRFPSPQNSAPLCIFSDLQAAARISHSRLRLAANGIELPASSLPLPESDRYTRAIKTAPKLLKTNNRAPSYSVQFSSPKNSPAMVRRGATNHDSRLTSRAHHSLLTSYYSLPC